MTDKELPDWYAAVTQRAQQEAANAPEATVRATEYSVNCVPEDDINSYSFQIRVQYRGNDRYAVIRGGDMCLDTALKLAKAQAPLVTVNGYTVADAIAMQKKRAERDA